ncbi:MAG TPA: Gfo/Idh/MocA family oxidoreductase [Lachnospiraceae bacterium]
MRKIVYGLVGSGWRAEFYVRIAKAIPEQFEVSAVLIRDHVKGEIFAKKYQVKVVNTLEELMDTEPEFIVLSIKRGVVTDYLVDLFQRKIPVLVETPPAESVDELYRLWEEYEKVEPKIQVAEQYPLQPLYASWYEAIQKGMLGDVTNMNISALHGYHGVAMLRRMLGVGMEQCVIYGKRYQFPVTETYSREGMCFDGEVFLCPRERVTLEFSGGKIGYFDFSDPAQYHSFIRTRQINIQGTRGEIDDLTILYLTQENVSVMENLNRIDLGIYGNQEWSHFAMMLGKETLYKTPFVNARLNDDEIAVGTLLLKFVEYMETGKECYSLADACQDMYINLMMNKAMENPLKLIKTEKQPWN